jgi:predicted phage tail protein
MTGETRMLSTTVNESGGYGKRRIGGATISAGIYAEDQM